MPGAWCSRACRWARRGWRRRTAAPSPTRSNWWPTTAAPRRTPGTSSATLGSAGLDPGPRSSVHNGRTKIGSLARQADVAIGTGRDYERQGLLPAPARTAPDHRSYADGAVGPRRFIRRAKALGFTLGEIRELLELTGRRAHDMAGVKSAASQKLADVDARIAELQRMRGGLERLVAACPGHGPLEHCPILDALSGDER